MTKHSKPKVLIFDIGGVCVISPFQAILDYEHANSIPRGYINYAISASKPAGSWHKLEKGQILLDTTFFSAFRSDIRNPTTWRRYHLSVLKYPPGSPLPAIPEIDAESLYWTMMSTARETDPYMGPALRRLKASGRFPLVALSNTSIFPPGHAFNEPQPGDIREVFEVFVSSAHVGMRKPERDIYEYTMGLVRERYGEVEPGEVVFLDDIGENLKMGREMGWRTVKVGLGRTKEAVRELEGITGLELLEEKARL